MKIDPEKSYTKKELRYAYGKISATTFRRWLNEIPGLKDYYIKKKGKKEKKIYYRTLKPHLVKKIVKHLEDPGDD